MPSARSSAARSTPRTASARSASARSATATAARPAIPDPGRSSPGFQPRRVGARGPLSRIRWDRAARLGLLAALALIGYLWLSGLSTLFHSHAQAERGLRQVSQLAATHRQLEREAASLRQRSTILSRARDLGMVKQGEQPFIVTH